MPCSHFRARHNLCKMIRLAEVDRWIDYLSGQDWQFFATFTMAPRCTLCKRFPELHETDRWGKPNPCARYTPGTMPTTRSLRRAADALQEAAGFDRMFWVCEKGARNGRKHLHALIEPHRFETQDGHHAPTTGRGYIFRWWKARYGRVDVVTYYRHEGAGKYVGKYLLKEPDAYDYLCRSKYAPARPQI